MTPSVEDIAARISQVVGDVTRDWGLSATLTSETRLNADLGFTSMDIIDLFASLEIQFQRKFPYESFITVEGGGYRPDLTIGELSVFIHQHYDTGRPGPTPV